MNYNEFVKGKLYKIKNKIGIFKYIGQDVIRKEDEGHHGNYDYVLLHFINMNDNKEFNIDTETKHKIDSVEYVEPKYFEPIMNTNGKFICPECNFELPPNKTYWKNFMHKFTCSLKGFIPYEYNDKKKYKIQLNKETNIKHNNKNINL